LIRLGCSEKENSGRKLRGVGATGEVKSNNIKIISEFGEERRDMIKVGLKDKVDSYKDKPYGPIEDGMGSSKVVFIQVTVDVKMSSSDILGVFHTVG
jgi:hypothetical protein